MDDDQFPSGPWTGFYNYTGPEDRHRMDLHLDFSDGRMTGDGTDNVGAFLVAGGYDTGNRECWWTKTYPGSHHVLYRCCCDGNGIWGTWEILPRSRGGFHIWPQGVGDGDGASKKAEVNLPRRMEVVTPDA